jgi:hypothetical protein
MSFEVYRPRTRATTKAKSPIIRLSKNSLVLSKVARERLNNPEYLELAFDTDTGTIRIKPAGKVCGVSLKKTKVAAKDFFESFKISDIGNYIADYNAEENALYVKIA